MGCCHRHLNIGYSWRANRYMSNGTQFGGKSIHWPRIQHQSLFYGGRQAWPMSDLLIQMSMVAAQTRGLWFKTNPQLVIRAMGNYLLIALERLKIRKWALKFSIQKQCIHSKLVRLVNHSFESLSRRGCWDVHHSRGRLINQVSLMLFLTTTTKNKFESMSDRKRFKKNFC